MPQSPYSRGVEDQRPLGWRDLAVPAVLLVIGVVELASLGTEGWLPSIGLEGLAAAALVFRRTHPVVAVPISAVALMSIPWTGTRMDDAAAPIFFYVVGMYSLGRYLPIRGGILTAALTLALVTVTFLFDPSDNDLTDVVFVLSLAVPPYVFGRVSRKLAQQSALVERQAEQLRDQAVRDERDRIARELHDVIAHSVSAMVVQTAAAQDLVRTQPERAAELLATVAETGRTALAETGRLLHLVRDDADELGLAPAPGLAQLPDLLESMRAAGLDLDADLQLPDAQLSGGVDVSAYRVVQEALTNALKYGAGPTRLAVRAEQGVLRVSCRNPVASAAAAGGAGLGLQGMAERVRLLGGSMEHGRVDGHYEVTALVPLGTAS